MRLSFLDRLSVFFLLFAIAIYPYVFWANFAAVFAGYRIPFVSIITFIIFVSFMISLFKFKQGNSFLIIFFVSTLIVLALFLRVSYYHEDLFFSSYRNFLLLLVYAISLFYVLRSDFTKEKISSLLILNITVQAVFGIIHFYFFPYIVTGVELDDSGTGIYFLEPGEGGYRESGMLIGSNVYGNFLVLGLFLTMINLKISPIKDKIINISIALLILWAVYLSGSRLALANALIIFSFFLFRCYGIKYFFIPVVLITSSIFLTPIIDNAIERTVSHGSSSRLAKSQLALNMLDESVMSAIIGPSSITVSAARTLDGLPFSDNSYLLLSLTYGIPIAVMCFILVLGFIFKSVRLNAVTFVFVVYFLSTLFFNNAILWDIWLFYGIAVIYIISGRTIIVVDKKLIAV